MSGWLVLYREVTDPGKPICKVIHHLIGWEETFFLLTFMHKSCKAVAPVLLSPYSYYNDEDYGFQSTVHEVILIKCLVIVKSSKEILSLEVLFILFIVLE